MASQGQRRARRRYNRCYYWSNRTHEECVEYALGGRVGSSGSDGNASGQAKSLFQIPEALSEDFKANRYQIFLPYLVILGIGVVAYYKLKW